MNKVHLGLPVICHLNALIPTNQRESQLNSQTKNTCSAVLFHTVYGMELRCEGQEGLFWSEGNITDLVMLLGCTHLPKLI